MTVVVIILCLVIAALSACGVFVPQRSMGFVKVLVSPKGIWSLAAFRVVFGTALYFTAATSKVPDLLTFLGVLIIIKGLITPLFGKPARRFFDWWFDRKSGILRFVACIGLAISLGLIYAVIP